MSVKPPLRHNARRYAAQALYQWHFVQGEAPRMIQEFIEDHVMEDTDIAYFQTLVAGVIKHVALVDQAMQIHLDRKITALNPVELAILRLAIYEFMHCPDVPYKVVINEALELTKEFGSEAGYKYVNGVLDAFKGHRGSDH